jgi:hypothetical protein
MATQVFGRARSLQGEAIWWGPGENCRAMMKVIGRGGNGGVRVIFF